MLTDFDSAWFFSYLPRNGKDYEDLHLKRTGVGESSYL